MAGFPHLVVRVRQELDDEGEEVGRDDVVHRLWQLLAVHGNVRHLLHQLGSHTWLCEKKFLVRTKEFIIIMMCSQNLVKADAVLSQHAA